jgi:hypothetical protein
MPQLLDCAAPPKAAPSTPAASSPGIASLDRTVRLLRDAKLPVSLFRFAARRIDPLMLEFSLEEAVGQGGLIEPLGDGAILVILPRFADEPASMRWRVLAALGTVLSREWGGGHVEMEMAELHCRADTVADSADLMVQLLAAPRHSVAIFMPGADPDRSA